MGRIKSILVALSAVVLSGCLAPENVLMTRVDMHRWDRFESITYENSDTLSLRTLNIAVRYNSEYKPNKLQMMVVVTTPDNRYFEEEVALNLRHPQTAISVTTTESLPYRDSAVLTQKGAYKFYFAPLSEVRGIEAVGIDFREISE